MSKNSQTALAAREPSAIEPFLQDPRPDETAAPATAPEDWVRAVETLAVVSRARDGNAAARHTEIRRRMRLLARAIRAPAGS